MPLRPLRQAIGAVTLVVAALFCCVAALAADHPLRGVALVIGEGAYDSLPKLANPPSDARALDRLLDDLGFDVTRVLDADGQKLRDRLERFAEDAADADVALVYYSGHGIEAGGENFLVPTDADISSPKAAGESLLPLSGLLDELRAKVPVTIVLLDACRTSPYPAGQAIELPGSGEMVAVAPAGLAATRGPTPLGTASPADPDGLGMVIGFAAEPGQAALDGAPGENSPYAAALIKHIAAGGYSFADIMTMVTEEVYLKTKAQQLPWTNSSLRRVLSFGQPAQDEPTGDEALIRDGRRQLLLSIASAPETTRHYVETVAGSEGVPLDALYGMLKVLGVDTSTGEADLEKQLADGAKRLKEMAAQQLGIVQQDSELLRLGDLAQRAEDEGAIDIALKFREEATARARELSKSRDQLEADLKSDRLQIGATYAANAQTAVLNFDFQSATDLFGEAFDEVEKWDDTAAFSYRWQQAEALESLGQTKGDNPALRQAIDLYTGLATEQLRQTQPDDWARSHVHIAHAHDLLGDHLEDVEETRAAVAAYELAETVWTRDGQAREWASVEVNRGSALLSMATYGDGLENNRQAIEAFTSAIAVLQAGDNRESLATAQFQLGVALEQRGTSMDEPALYAEAQTALVAAQAVWTRATAPVEWALIQHVRASVEQRLAIRDSDGPLLEQSAAHFRDALEERKRGQYPLDWADSEIGLAKSTAWLGILRKDSALLHEAVQKLQLALEEATPERVPGTWVRAQEVMGDTLDAIGSMENDPNSHLLAVAAYREALEHRDKVKDPLAWAVTQNSLGGSLGHVASGTGDLDNVDAAIAAYRAALTVFTPDLGPQYYARAEFNLGAALSFLGQQRGDPDQLAAGAAAYRAALAVWTSADNRADWADTQSGLGDVLNIGGQFGGDTSQLLESAAAMRAALTVYTPDGNPAQWQNAQHTLAMSLALADMIGGGTAHYAEALAALEALVPFTDKAANLPAWAEFSTWIGLIETRLGEAGQDVGASQKAADILAETVAAYDTMGDGYNLAWAEDGRCRALLGVGAMQGDMNVLGEAKAACQHAIDLSQQQGNATGAAQTGELLGRVGAALDYLLGTAVQ